MAAVDNVSLAISCSLNRDVPLCEYEGCTILEAV